MHRHLGVPTLGTLGELSLDRLREFQRIKARQERPIWERQPLLRGTRDACALGITDHAHAHPTFHLPHTSGELPFTTGPPPQSVTGIESRSLNLIFIEEPAALGL